MAFVVSAQEMARLEELAIADGCSREEFMREAGRKVACQIMRRSGAASRVLLLVGKGNKGGDALVAGGTLLQEGYIVHALSVFAASESGPLNQAMRPWFEERGGEWIDGPIDWTAYDVIVDGLLGTGFHGALAPHLADLIGQVNQLPVLRVAIDLPSGLDGTTGEGAETAFRANVTIALGAAKGGCFLQDGWNSIGELVVEDFGLPSSYLQQAKVFAQLVDRAHLRLPPLVRNRHKYQAGYVVGFGGSKHFSGAPKLASLAALRSGAGIVRLFYPKEAEAGMVCCFPELIHAVWDEASWIAELKRASALFVGPGLGSSVDIKQWLKMYVAPVLLPVVLDADALVADPNCLPKNVVLTPHRGEALRLLGHTTLSAEKLLQECQAFSDRTGAVIVLKGAPTFVFSCGQVPFIIPYGDPGMATAGTGDVLTGMITAFLAQGLLCSEAALLGATLHALAGQSAARKCSSYAMIATDLIEQLIRPEIWDLPLDFGLISHVQG